MDIAGIKCIYGHGRRVLFKLYQSIKRTRSIHPYRLLPSEYVNRVKGDFYRQSKAFRTKLEVLMDRRKSREWWSCTSCILILRNVKIRYVSCNTLGSKFQRDLMDILCTIIGDISATGTFFESLLTRKMRWFTKNNRFYIRGRFQRFSEALWTSYNVFFQMKRLA